MANPERGVYQPPPEDIQVYDPAADEEQERSRLPILILIALLILAAFAGVVWLAYNQGVARGRADGGPRVIAAPEGPTRTAPQETQSTTPYTGLKVYDKPVPPEEDAETTTEAPAPASQLPSETQPPAIRVPQSSAPSVAAVPPAAEPKLTLPEKTPPKQKAPAPQATQVATAAPAPLTTPAPAPAPATAATTSASAGGILLQIGSFPDEATANAAWKHFQAKHAATLQGFGPDIKSFDLGAKGTWYRLRVGSFADKASALAICDKLKAEGAAGCFIAAP